MVDVQNILIVDNERNMCESLKILLRDDHRYIETVYSGAQAKIRLDLVDFDLLVIEPALPDGGGERVLDFIERRCPDTSVIVVTGHPSLESAVKTMRQGTCDYFKKPFEPDELITSVGNVLSRKRLEKEHKMDDEKRVEKNIFFHTVFNSSSSPCIFTTDLDLNVRFWNKGAEILFGYTAEEITNRRKIYVLCPREREKETLTAIRYRILEKKECRSVEIQSMTKDRRKVWIDFNFSPRLDDRGNVLGILGIGKDITDNRLAQEQYRRLLAQVLETKKIEAVGSLAAGMAHQFNNALLVISGHLDLIDTDYPQDKQLTAYTNRMMISVKRMTQLTNQLLAYASEGRYESVVLSVNDIVRETLSDIRHQISPDVQLHLSLDTGVSDIKVDRKQIRAALSAVLHNASEAVENEGVIEITTEQTEIPAAPVISEPALKPGRYACITVKDNGRGMDKEIKNRIFDPFFSTKFKGRGLGMSAAYGIVRSHNGFMTIESEKGKGTAVHTHLPLHIRGEAEAEEVRTDKKAALLVEGDEMLLELDAALLKQLGYRVLKAANEKEALNVAATAEDDIDIALVDIDRSDIRAMGFYQHLMECRPGLRVVISSGNPPVEAVQQVLGTGACGFIQRPFTVAGLATKLSEVNG